MGQSPNEPVPQPSEPSLPADLVKPEVSSAGLKSDESGQAEARNWFRLGKWLPGLPSKEGVDVVSTIINIVLRVLMSGAFLGMAWWWLWIVGGIVEKQTTDKHLSDTVLVALLTTTTINVLGLLYFVANYLFPKQVGKDDPIPRTPVPPEPPIIPPP